MTERLRDLAKTPDVQAMKTRAETFADPGNYYADELSLGCQRDLMAFAADVLTLVAALAEAEENWDGWQDKAFELEDKLAAAETDRDKAQRDLRDGRYVAADHYEARAEAAESRLAAAVRERDMHERNFIATHKRAVAAEGKLSAAEQALREWQRVSPVHRYECSPFSPTVGCSCGLDAVRSLTHEYFAAQETGKADA